MTARVSVRRSRWPAGLAAILALLATAAGCTRAGATLAGQWQLSWQGRIGTERATLLLQPGGGSLSGSFGTARASAPLAGSVHGSQLSFAVDFPGPPPYRVVFTGTMHADRLTGLAQPQDVNGRAFAGHGGEVAHDYYTWTAVRAVPGNRAMAGASAR